MALKKYSGSCHCGALKFEADIDLSKGTTKCNCSICAKARAWFALVEPEHYRPIAGTETQAEYHWTPPGHPTPNIHYHFCRTCGIRAVGKVNTVPKAARSISSQLPRLTMSMKTNSQLLRYIMWMANMITTIGHPKISA
jgi:hypothetical protein